jgi:two-component system CheB/CheR fusion protein
VIYQGLTRILALDHPQVDQRSDSLDSASFNQPLEMSTAELLSQNQQLQNKLSELITSNKGLNTLLSNSDIPALFLDAQLCIRHFTPQIRHLFDLNYSDMGQPVGTISHYINNLDLLTDAGKVLTSQMPLEKEVCTVNAECFIQRIKPFRTKHKKPDGVPVAYVDVTRLKRLQARKLHHSITHQGMKI